MLSNKKHLFQQTLLLMLLLTPFLLRGQIKKKGEDQTKAVSLERIVKLSPMALIDPFGPTVAAYFEQQLPNRKKWTSLEGELAYTFKVTGMTSEAFGYRFRAAYRQYFKNKWREKGNGYLSLALMDRQFYDKGTQFLWRNDRNYQQNLDYKVTISQQSATINIGTMRYFGYQSRFNLDMSIGLGLRRSHILFKNLPDDALTPVIPDAFERNFKKYVSETTEKERTHFFYNTALAVKLGYVLQKNPLADKKLQRR